MKPREISTPETSCTINQNDCNHENGFFGCYLLDSVHPRALSLGGRTYIGFTVDPKRRLRQHNGELSQGAYKTRKWRPWDMVLVVHGFVNQRTALQFEWTWQHAETSLDTRQAVLKIKRLIHESFTQKKKKSLRVGGVVGQVLLLFAILSTPPWKHFPLHIRCTSGTLWRMVGDALQEILEVNKKSQTEFFPGFMLLPEHMTVSIGPLRDFKIESLVHRPSEMKENDSISDVSATTPSPQKSNRKNMRIRCVICCELAQRTWSECWGCGCRTHVGCLAQHFLQKLPDSVVHDEGHDKESSRSDGQTTCMDRQKDSLPQQGICPMCSKESSWSSILARLKTAGWKKHVNNSESNRNNGNCSSTTPKAPRSDVLSSDKEDVAQAKCRHAKTPLESLILDTQIMSLNPIDEESLAFRMLRRLREGNDLATASQENDGGPSILVMKDSNKENQPWQSDAVDTEIISLCSSEDYVDIVELVNDSPV